METKLEQIAVKAVNQLPKSVVREIRTPRSVGAGGGRPPPATRWARRNPRPYRDHAGWLPSPRVFLAGEEPAFNILFVGHPTPANLSERVARTGHSGDRALPTVTITCRGPVESISLRPPKSWRLVHLHLARP